MDLHSSPLSIPGRRLARDSEDPDAYLAIFADFDASVLSCVDYIGTLERVTAEHQLQQVEWQQERSQLLQKNRELSNELQSLKARLEKEREKSMKIESALQHLSLHTDRPIDTIEATTSAEPEESQTEDEQTQIKEEEIQPENDGDVMSEYEPSIDESQSSTEDDNAISEAKDQAERSPSDQSMLDTIVLQPRPTQPIAAKSEKAPTDVRFWLAERGGDTVKKLRSAALTLGAPFLLPEDQISLALQAAVSEEIGQAFATNKTRARRAADECRPDKCMHHWVGVHCADAVGSDWIYGNEFACKRCTNLGKFCIVFMERSDTGAGMPVVLPLDGEERATGAKKGTVAYYRKNIKRG